MRPRLIHPVEVVVERVDKAATEYDADFREPVNEVTYSAVVRLQAQVKFDRFEARNMTPGGDAPQTTGYLLISADRANEIQKGDKISKIGEVPVELFITEKRPAVHYGKARMIKVFFEAGERG